MDKIEKLVVRDEFINVRDAFTVQAKNCEKMGSPFYANLLPELRDLFSPTSAIGEVFSSWEGEPQSDAVALRFVAALHFLVISEQDSDLSEAFPPSPMMVGELRADLLLRSIEKHENLILEFLKSPPQTNEVGRSMVLLGGFLEVANRFGGDMNIYELGASAGLNLSFDQYFYQTDEWQWGKTDSKVRFKPFWKGPAPALGAIKIHERKACDISPIDINTQKNRLLSYVWPDQVERLARIRGALDIAASEEIQIDCMEAAQWLEKLSQDMPRTRPSVFYHSIIWQYFSAQQKNDFKVAMEKIGSTACSKAPVIYMRLEPSETGKQAELRIKVWPNETEELLAISGFHGEWIEWYGP